MSTGSRPATSAPLRGRWFDGRSSQARPVQVVIVPSARGPSLRLHRLDAVGAPPLELPHAAVGWPELWSSDQPPLALTVDLGDHGSLAVDDVAGWRKAAQDAGVRPGLAARLAARWPVFLAALVLAVATLGVFYRWGTPWLAQTLAGQVPVGWELQLAERGLAALDGQWLRPSRLPPGRQQALRARFDELAAVALSQAPRGYAPRLTLQFRHGLGANAFALPGGTVVMTDALVQEAARRGLPDEALVGVLAHELGHVIHRHGTRLLVEQGVLNIGLGLALGDMSSLLTLGGNLLTGLAYRRGHETEADCFARRLMQAANLPTAPMADLLLALEAQRGSPATHRGDTRPGPDWFSSHPDTGHRARQLRAGAPAC